MRAARRTAEPEVVGHELRAHACRAVGFLQLAGSGRGALGAVQVVGRHVDTVGAAEAVHPHVLTAPDLKPEGNHLHELTLGVDADAAHRRAHRQGAGRDLQNTGAWREVRGRLID